MGSKYVISDVEEYLFDLTGYLTDGTSRIDDSLPDRAFREVFHKPEAIELAGKARPEVDRVLKLRERGSSTPPSRRWRASAYWTRATWEVPVTVSPALLLWPGCL